MATDGASCEPDFSRASEDAAGAAAEAAVTGVPGRARGTSRLGPVSRLDPACDPGRPESLGSPLCAFPVVPFLGMSSWPEARAFGVRRLPGLGIPLVLSEPSGKHPRPLGCRGFPRASRATPTPFPWLWSPLARGEGRGVFPGELDTPSHCSPLPARVAVGACLT